ncbi:TPA: hypothetical protein QEL43_000399 [Stenotrophomonas maltophilia]|nr:hypothetical protein [Stenotrophomonas maltophilia]
MAKSPYCMDATGGGARMNVLQLIPRRDAGIAALMTFGMGVLVTAIAMIGSDIPLKCIDAGNAADWLAALGTWVAAAGAVGVGFGANRYAREAHDLRINEINRERRENIARLDRQLAVAILRIIPLKGIVDTASDLSEEFRRDTPDKDLLQVFSDFVIPILDRAALTADDLINLPPEGMVTAGELGIQIANMRFMLGVHLNSSYDDEYASENLRIAASRLVDDAAAMNDTVDKLIALIQSLRGAASGSIH